MNKYHLAVYNYYNFHFIVSDARTLQTAVHWYIVCIGCAIMIGKPQPAATHHQDQHRRQKGWGYGAGAPPDFMDAPYDFNIYIRNFFL